MGRNRSGLAQHRAAMTAPVSSSKRVRAGTVGPRRMMSPEPRWRRIVLGASSGAAGAGCFEQAFQKGVNTWYGFPRFRYDRARFRQERTVETPRWESVEG